MDIAGLVAGFVVTLVAFLYCVKGTGEVDDVQHPVEGDTNGVY